MNLRTLVVFAAFASLIGCASNQQAIDCSMGQAEASKSIAKELNVKPSTAAVSNLDSAKILLENGEEEDAIIMANMSSLEYKLAVYTSERDDVKKQDEQLEKALREDMERKVMYQKSLEQSVKGGN